MIHVKSVNGSGSAGHEHHKMKITFFLLTGSSPPEKPAFLRKNPSKISRDLISLPNPRTGSFSEDGNECHHHRLSLAISPSSSSSQASSTSLTLATRPLKTSFFNGGVGAFKAAGIQTATANKTICSGHGGGALGAQMNLFDRFARVIKSYANAVLSSVEDPEKILEQTVLEMNDDLTKMRQATAQVLASQKRLENKYKVAQQASDDWYRRAQIALEKGEEDLAREALKRRKSYADNASTLKAQFDQQKNVVENLVSNTRLLESKIQEAKSKKDTLKARAQSAKTATKVSEMLGNVNTSSSLSAFEKMEEKVMAMESQAEALNQLTTDDLEGKFALLESSSVDDDLANLKKELSGSPMKGELPASRSAAVSSTNAAFPFRDSEIENELNELRRKAKEF
ncbi:putative membrane-associated protein, chloroplastic [Cinnamomum micranthum f. kanehirae]|uniref:Putative membrane-associated protein, chloroplastic n=1 Tax=Cinnamomum micranthum f. kanehirae TaxID=337451 RepID=A0A443N0B5_9MAGN|nr:putative membrane-associated protein, chloroplastic [Cinnamomum micranthum f. kanehirae]